MVGPRNGFSQALHAAKYRTEEESFADYCRRYAEAVGDTTQHRDELIDALENQRLLPAGRQQLAVGRPYDITAYNCFVGGEIEDSMRGIMHELTNSAMTLRSGGGCGWDFSTLRPRGDRVKGLGHGAFSSGPVSFMRMWDAMCTTVHSAGNRRGAMMAVMRCDHPDIEEFINAKTNQDILNRFNISVAVTDEFMAAVQGDKSFNLHFDGRVYRTVRALDLWELIMANNWDWAEPGILYIDRINAMNPLNYCERIHATNPCSEQPLPPFGACLLGSLNIVKYIKRSGFSENSGDNIVRQIYSLDFDQIIKDTATAVRAFDNVIDHTRYPLKEQEMEAKSKRRMGLGVTGMANALEICGHAYGSEDYIKAQSYILQVIRDAAYTTSIRIATKKGPFPNYSLKWLDSGFARTLPEQMRQDIARYGLRNGLLLSIAPTGTISLTADNISSGIEPPYSLEVSRRIQMPEGEIEVELKDYAYEFYNKKCKTADQVSAEEHIKVLCAAQKYVDSAVSKTCNVGANVSFDEFKQLYMHAYVKGAKGCSTFRMDGKRFGIMKAVEREEEDNNQACYYDPESGTKTCEA